MAAEHDQLNTLQAALARFSEGAASAASLSELARGQAQLLAALPPRYSEVLLNLPNVKDRHTSFSLGEVKAGGALPLAHLG